MIRRMRNCLPSAVFRIALAGGAGVVGLWLAAIEPAAAQQRQQLAPAETAIEPAPPAEATPPARRPGLLEALGELFEKSADDLGDFNRRAGEATLDAARGVGDAAGNFGRLPGTRLADGRALCPPAANGAPDCVTAASALCKSKGFGPGTSLATESGEKCPARVYLSGRTPKAGECRMETFVTRAMCQ